MGIERLSDLVTSDYISKRNKVTKVTSDYNYVSTKRSKLNYSEREAKTRAEYIARKLDNYSRLMFYLKCAWNLTDNYLDRLLVIALTKNDPIRYFSKAASNEMIKNN